MKLFLLLYADDTVIFSETKEDMQHALLEFEEYCYNWKLQVNASKTKIVIFSKEDRIKMYSSFFKIIYWKLQMNTNT